MDNTFTVSHALKSQQVQYWAMLILINS